MSVQTAPAGANMPRPRRALAAVVFVVFVDLLGFGIIIPILPFYVRSFPGSSDVYIGLLAASYSLLQFLSAPYLGRLSDERGRRPVILLSVAGSAVAWTVFGIGGSLLVLFASRMLAGAMGGNLAAAQAYIADVTPPERRAGALGLIGASFGLGFIFGPALGGVFASATVVAAVRGVAPAFVPVTQFSLPSFAAATLSVLNLAFAARYLAEPPRASPAGPRVSWVGQFVTALRDAGLRGLVVSFFVVSVAFSGMQVMFIPFAADHFGYAESQTALLLTYIGVLSVVVQGVLVGRLSARYAQERVAVAGAGLLVVALATIPFTPALGRTLVPAPGPPFPAFLTPQLVALLLVLPVLAAGNGLLSVALTTLVSTRASAAAQGSAFGVTQGAGSLGRTVGPVAMATLYVGAFWAPFVVGALLVVPVLGLLARRAVPAPGGAGRAGE